MAEFEKKDYNVFEMFRKQWVVVAAGTDLTPVPVDNGIMFKKAELTFVCRKIYQHMMANVN